MRLGRIGKKYFSCRAWAAISARARYMRSRDCVTWSILGRCTRAPQNFEGRIGGRSVVRTRLQGDPLLRGWGFNVAPRLQIVNNRQSKRGCCCLGTLQKNTVISTAGRNLLFLLRNEKQISPCGRNNSTCSNRRVSCWSAGYIFWPSTCWSGSTSQPMRRARASCIGGCCPYCSLRRCSGRRCRAITCF